MKNNILKKVVVAISGGVDSSVSAYLLKERGYQVIGLFMKNWEEDDKLEYCSSLVDFSDAQHVCKKIGIKLYKINFSLEYWNNVFTKFIFEYQSGKTPNPDVLCNKEIKFKVFLRFSIENFNADYIATGHYARCQFKNGKYQLLKGIDIEKDQSYFLYNLNQNQLSKILFPIGSLKKKEVRRIARNVGLVTADKKDSTGICFIGKRNFRNFLGKYIRQNPGKIISMNGECLGKHLGLMYYTIGQRKGLGIGGTKQGNGAPWYVIKKDIKNNILIVDQDRNFKFLKSTGLILKKIHWINLEISKKNIFCTIRTRYRQKETKCMIDISDVNKIIVKFSNPIIAVTPGQSAVFYNKEICLGGGIIQKIIK